MFRPMLIAASASGFLLAAPMAGAAPIAVTELQAARLGIETGEVTLAAEHALAVLPGRITLPQDGANLIPAIYGGTVRRFVALEGAAVSKGQPILSVESPDYLAASADLAEQRARLDAARAAAKRARQLADEGIGAASVAETAEAEAASLEAMVKALGKRLSAVKADPETPGAYLLLAPRAGTIGNLPVAPGEAVAASDIAAALGNGGTLWLDANLPAALIGSVAPGQRLSVEPGNGEATILSVGKVIDPESRAVSLRARLDEGSDLAAGSLVRVTVRGSAASGSLQVPRNALIRVDGQETVFVARKDSFEPVAVEVLSRGARDAAVAGNLQAGDRVAISGLTELKALALAGE